jgi:Zn-dependent M32 family carboxypeptidase
MRLYEFVTSKDQVLDVVRDLLIRAKSEGADSVSLDQLTNEFDGTIDVDTIRQTISDNRQSMKGLIGDITDTEVTFEKPTLLKHKEKSDQSFNKKAVATALKGLNQ